MKHFLFLMCVCLLPIMAYGQKVTSTKVDGGTVLTTSETICRSFTDKQVLSVSLSAIIVNKDTTFLLNAKVTTLQPTRIPENGRLLLKFADDSVVKLVSITSEESNNSTMNLGTTTTITKIGQTWYAKTYKNDINVSSIVGSYIIDKNTLISSFKGIKKIRLELSPDNYDKEFSKDKVGKALESQYKAILNYNIKSFDEGF